ncbi:hypothetical protein [Burkholderia ubonensis]|uniref:hypothetical protein n=1 Tax=Burkholderia ubonensis TaxID=101571 RepID=UPI000B06FD1A|nr:hypothetical protein [Burkholderia ubonensis]
MPTMSVFSFERQAMQMAGPFRQMHTEVDGYFTWEAMWSVPEAHAIVAYIRPDSEIAMNLSAVMNDPAVVAYVDNQLASAPANPQVRPPVRRGAIRTSYKTWGEAIAAPETHVTDQNDHDSSELINTINIDFHCNTDWYMSALDGTITIYVYFYLDEQGKVHSRIEGWSDPVWDEQPWRPDFGAAGAVSKAIATDLAQDQPILQSFLDNALSTFAGDGSYSNLYTLPGTGATVGVTLNDDADMNVALCLVPMS